ncbi:MAG: hypothetical protein M3Y73_07835 [Actinomycetota bacterium]|nr:hypothetical protein [Actinomycetota bacterium]
MFGDVSAEVTLRAASLDTCRALVAVTNNDLTNLEAAAGLILQACLPIGATAAVLFWLMMPGFLWLPFAAGWGGGYLAYDLLHAYLHVGRPRTALRAGCVHGICATTSRTLEETSA